MRVEDNQSEESCVGVLDWWSAQESERHQVATLMMKGTLRRRRRRRKTEPPRDPLSAACSLINSRQSILILIGLCVLNSVNVSCAASSSLGTSTSASNTTNLDKYAYEHAYVNRSYYRGYRNVKTRNLISYGFVSGGTTDTSKSKDSIHIAGFFPTSSLRNVSSEGAIGRGVLPAVKLAIYHINNNNTTLPDYKLHISWNDTKGWACSEPCARKQAQLVFNPNKTHLSPYKTHFNPNKTHLPLIKLFLNSPKSNTNACKLNVSKNQNGSVLQKHAHCSASDGMKAFFDMMHDTPLKYMLFGDACTQVTDPIAKASRYWKVAQLSYADMHPMFSKKNYPNLFRIVPSENEFNAPRLALLRKYNWTKVGTLYQNKPRYSLAHNNLVGSLEPMGVRVVAAQSFADDISYHIHKLKEKDVRIILGNFNETWARRIFCEAYRENLYGKKYQWLIVAAYTPTWWRKQDDVNCTVEEVETALKGALLMDLLPLSSSSDITISGLVSNFVILMFLFPNILTEALLLPQTADQYNDMYQVVKLNEYSRFHGYAYDGIWAIALALHNMSKFYPDPALRHRKDLLRNFKYRDDNWQAAFLNALNATSFTGVTGKVEFKDNGRKGTILIKQFRAFNTVNAEVKVGEFDGGVGDAEHAGQQRQPDRPPASDRARMLLSRHQHQVQESEVHKDEQPVPEQPDNNRVHVHVHERDNPGLDSKLTSIEAFPYICTARAWILMAGFTLAFGSMFSKTWRVHSIFTNVKLNKKVIKDMQLFIVVGILLAIDFAIMTTWHFTDPMVRDTKKLEAYNNPNNDDIMIIPENEYCKSQYMSYFVGTIYAYKGLLMLFGCFLAWETRNVSIPALNDSKYIGMSVYNSVMMCVLGAPLSHVLTDKHDASFLIISVFIIFCTTATLCLIIELKRNPKGTVEKRLRPTIKPPSTTRRASATSMYEAELKTAKQQNQKIRKQIREVDNEIQALAKILGDDAQDILHDAMHNLALPKSEVLKKEGEPVLAPFKPICRVFYHPNRVFLLNNSHLTCAKDTDVSSLYSLNSDGGEDVFIEEAPEATPNDGAGGGGGQPDNNGNVGACDVSGGKNDLNKLARQRSPDKVKSENEQTL
ncbi:Gamma-aminobutyric acid type B receptor subunit 1 [Orchesella cincta]|uniref:Gamma-aminobutyric acid type B receptor subunit 2 n=1 Tax=Orchesella cincta TaxID=48709 RepID=A0A1D2MR09_ORCCI|nr:Gamma-aminobutyric acid type B receptor subunit 1 [Orchesella cincta]